MLARRPRGLDEARPVMCYWRVMTAARRTVRCGQWSGVSSGDINQNQISIRIVYLRMIYKHHGLSHSHLVLFKTRDDGKTHTYINALI